MWSCDPHAIYRAGFVRLVRPSEVSEDFWWDFAERFCRIMNQQQGTPNNA